MRTYSNVEEMKMDAWKFSADQAVLVRDIVAQRQPLDTPALAICPDCDDCGCGEQGITVGRKKRKRKKGAGSGVKVRSHTRSPRGPNAGKKKVRVDGYARGKGKRKKSRRKRK